MIKKYSKILPLPFVLFALSLWLLFLGTHGSVDAMERGAPKAESTIKVISLFNAQLGSQEAQKYAREMLEEIEKVAPGNFKNYRRIQELRSLFDEALKNKLHYPFDNEQGQTYKSARDEVNKDLYSHHTSFTNFRSDTEWKMPHAQSVDLRTLEHLIMGMSKRLEPPKKDLPRSWEYSTLDKCYDLCKNHVRPEIQASAPASAQQASLVITPFKRNPERLWVLTARVISQTAHPQETSKHACKADHCARWCIHLADTPFVDWLLFGSGSPLSEQEKEQVFSTLSWLLRKAEFKNQTALYKRLPQLKKMMKRPITLAKACEELMKELPGEKPMIELNSHEKILTLLAARTNAFYAIHYIMTGAHLTPKGHYDWIKFLLSHSADPNATVKLGKEHLYRSDSTVPAMDATALDITLGMNTRRIADYYKEHTRALFFASNSPKSAPYCPEILKLLLDHGANPDHALLTAIALGNQEGFEVLLSYGAHSHEAYRQTIDHRRILMLKMLLNYYPLPKKELTEMLRYACRQGYKEGINELLTRGAYIPVSHIKELLTSPVTEGFTYLQIEAEYIHQAFKKIVDYQLALLCGSQVIDLRPLEALILRIAGAKPFDHVHSIDNKSVIIPSPHYAKLRPFSFSYIPSLFGTLTLSPHAIRYSQSAILPSPSLPVRQSSSSLPEDSSTNPSLWQVD